MSKLMLAMFLTVAVGFSTTAIGAPRAAAKASADKAEKAQAAPLDKDAQAKLKEHMKMRNHVKGVKYPATKEELVTAFKGFKDIKADDRKWFEETLPNKSFDNPDEVMKALGWEVSPDETASTEKRGKN
jgi:hypothetical protein